MEERVGVLWCREEDGRLHLAPHLWNRTPLLANDDAKARKNSHQEGRDPAAKWVWDCTTLAALEGLYRLSGLHNSAVAARKVLLRQAQRF